jgi:hypothetical protein
MKNRGTSQMRRSALRKPIWRTQMSRVFDHGQPSIRVHKAVTPYDQDLTAALAMCAVGLALSLITLTLMG